MRHHALTAYLGSHCCTQGEQQAHGMPEDGGARVAKPPPTPPMTWLSTSSNVELSRLRVRSIKHVPARCVKTPTIPIHLYRCDHLAPRPARIAEIDAEKMYDCLCGRRIVSVFVTFASEHAKRAHEM